MREVVAFQPARLRLARELQAWTQASLARAAGLTPAAISQFESGATRPAEATTDHLAELLDVPTGFLFLATAETHEGFFRSLKRTSVVDRRRARALAHVAHDLTADPALADRLPPVTVPELPIRSVDDDHHFVEEQAAATRRAWAVPAGPITDMVQLIEQHGIMVLRLPLQSTDVDAFSLPFSDRPVVVLGTDKNDRARSRFDAAHETGHLVMHGERIYGIKQIEDQAHWFAAAFLMPADDISDELPRTVDWPRLFALKQRWHTSLAALLMRARTLGALSEAQYLTAIKTASSRGWRRHEPVPLGEPEQPRLLVDAMNTPAGKAAREALPLTVLRDLENAAL